MQNQSEENRGLITQDEPNQEMSQQPGYNPNYQNPYSQHGAPPPPGFNTGNQGSNFPHPPPPMPHGSVFNRSHLLENGETGSDNKYSFQFSNSSIRSAFIRKVFSLVFIMLTVVAGVTAIPWIHKPAMRAVQYNMGIYYAGYGVFLITYLSLMCCEGTRRKFPLNIIVTTIFTFSAAVMTMVICAHHQASVVLLALAICMICTFSIVVFASQTKFDLTANVGFMMIVSVAFFAFSLVAFVGIVFFHIRFLITVYAGLGALLMMLYLFFDVQMLMGGRRLEISPEDYIFAAVQIFMDIIQLFWFILSLLGSNN